MHSIPLSLFKFTSYPTGQLTKCSQISDIANVFDLVGRVILVMINGKIFLQLLWVEGARWYDKRFQQFCNQNG